MPPPRMRVFTGVTYPGSTTTPRAAMPRSRSSARRRRPCSSPADDAHRHGRAAQGADVVDGVGAAAQAHVRAVVLEDEHGRLAAHPLHGAVEELVGDQVGQHEDAPPAEGGDDRVQPLPGDAGDAARHAFTGLRFRAGQDRSPPPPAGVRPRGRAGAASRRVVLQLAEAVAGLAPAPPRAPDAPRQLEVAVPVADHVRPREVDAELGRRRGAAGPGRGLRQSQSCRYGGSPTDGWCGQK